MMSRNLGMALHKMFRLNGSFFAEATLMRRHSVLIELMMEAEYRLA
jgi:hypothetical protein